MTRIAPLLALLALCTTGCTGGPLRPEAASLPPEARASPQRYLVVTVRNEARSVGLRAAGTPRGYDGVTAYSVSGEARALARGIATDYGLTETATWPIPLLGVHCIVYALPVQAERAAMLGRLAADARVESVQPLAMFATQTAAYNDPYAELQQSLVQMTVAEAQRWSRGAGVRLAMIDTGVDVGHPDLRGRIAARRNFVDANDAAFRTDMHGTAVAGVISALTNNRIGIAGIAPDVTLLAYKACWKPATAPDGAVCNSFTLARALAAAIDARANVVNLSLAGPADALLARLVGRGLERGIVFVGAAPPEGARAGFPGDVDGVITVDAPHRLVGRPAALVAPGRDVLTLVPGAHYDFASGSSLAAAQTSAVAALLLALDRHLDGAAIARLLERTSRPVATTAGTFRSIDACAALVAAQGHGTCPERATAASGLTRSGPDTARGDR